METKGTAGRAVELWAPAHSIPAPAVWVSLTPAQQERVRQTVTQVCRERLREERRHEPA